MSLGGYNMSTKKKIEKELEKENIIKEIKIQKMKIQEYRI